MRVCLLAETTTQEIAGLLDGVSEVVEIFGHQGSLEQRGWAKDWLKRQKEALASLSPSEVPKSAEELAEEIREGTFSIPVHCDQDPMNYDMTVTEAAALIDAYARQIRADEAAKCTERTKDTLIKAIHQYVQAYGPGYNSTDTAPYKRLIEALAIRRPYD